MGNVPNYPYVTSDGQVLTASYINDLVADLAYKIPDHGHITMMVNGVQKTVKMLDFTGSTGYNVVCTVYNHSTQETEIISGDSVPDWYPLLPSSKCTYQTTDPSADINDGGVHIVVLSQSQEPAQKKSGYIYIITE